MPLADTARSFAAGAVSVLFWWTVVSPLLAVAVALFAGRHPRLRYALTLAVVVPPMLELLPLAAMRGGGGALLAAAAAAADAAAAVLAVLALTGKAPPAGDGWRSRPAGLGAAATAAAVVGGMLGSLALLTAVAVS